MANAEQLIGAAKAYAGTKYRWSGHNPTSGLDCVGLVEVAYKQIGVPFPSSGSLPWTVPYLFDHWTGTKLLSSSNTPKPGNILIFVDVGYNMVHTGIAINATSFVSALVPVVAVAPINAIVGEYLRWILVDPRIANSVVIPAPVAPPAPKVNTYKVLAGDGWIVIARKFGITGSQLAAMNNKTTAYILHPGDVITVPGKV